MLCRLVLLLQIKIYYYVLFYVAAPLVKGRFKTEVPKRHYNFIYIIVLQNNPYNWLLLW
ncbi:hypothetical protein KKC1_09730 [Calderihabitans maritimus]|uniref:Uncharacterized protein n=1 Tax=Calderihabitans maritimus TaxID=1246530 RepID=A0A1Z5HQK3_9FIRM|nr:hypothetical protein KKC1_09730 [Calderihabitans maritimus]